MSYVGLLAFQTSDQHILCVGKIVTVTGNRVLMDIYIFYFLVELQVTDCRWLRACACNMAKQEMLAKVLSWLFTNFVMELIRVSLVTA